MRLIDADALKDHIKIFDIGCGCSEDYQKNFLSVIDEQPTIEPERKTGKWESESESLWEDIWSKWKCSACDKHVRIRLYDDPKEAGLMFCPNCGARMEE